MNDEPNVVSISMDQLNSIFKLNESEKLLQEENEKLKKQVRNLQLMIHNIQDFVGPNCLKLLKRFHAMNMKQFHVTWGDKAHLMTGEERAEFILGILNFERDNMVNNPPWCNKNKEEK